jgi:dienelactone hydrolase
LVTPGVASEASKPLLSAGPTLRPLLQTQDGSPIHTRSAWRKEARRLESDWREFLGPIPEHRPHPKPIIQEREALPGFTRLHIQYDVEPGVPMDGYLLEPMRAPGDKAKRPGVIVFHPTTPFQAKGVAGLAVEYPEDKHQGVQLVRRGYVVWCPRNFINTQDRNWMTNTLQVLATHTNWTGMTRMLLDAVVAMDFLERWPGVDRHRIGCLGHSLGAKEVLYAMAFDKRYKVGVSSEGGIGIELSNWDAPWYLGPRIKQPSRTLEHHQLLALVAPRPFLLIGGGSADGDPSMPFISAARHVYDLLGAKDHLQFLDHGKGHAYPPEARSATEAFLAEHL